jgi:Helix-turn-helix domain
MDKHATTPAAVYLTCDEAGTHLKLSPRTLEKMRTIGGGPRFRKLGRRVMYSLQDLEAWSDSRACESTSDPVYAALL